ncbi:MAG TPA: hypothetical protein VK034_18790, partial [Enhygromyxa sp.]|nr:hypothetical protein [Enhygromyxa sp.]
ESVDEATLIAAVERFLPAVPNPYFRATALQFGCELALIHGHRRLALDWLEQIDDTPFPDLDWLERCVVLEPIRETETYRRCATSIRARVDAINWR